MEIEKVNPEEEDIEDVNSLKGTIFSVSIVGAVIFFTWALLFILYMYRV